MDTNAAIASIRFGLGRAPGQAEPADTRRWLTQQLSAPDPGPPAASVAEAFAAFELDQLARRERKEAKAIQAQASANRASANQASASPGAVQPQAPAETGHARAIYRADSQALLDHALTTTTPFHERLVWFWANHFTVSIRNGMVASLVGAYVHDAIRPHVTGRFADMLLAVMRHPAMLVYLDNAVSAGPNSPVGSRSHRGLNENLARECLELHTISPAAGYTQADVTEFARVLTGWSVDRQDPPGFRFRPGLAEPGEKTVLGQRFPEGEQGGVLALAALATHPATHRHLATKLVTHFVADAPPADAVRRIEGVLRDTGGNLGAAAAAVVELPAAWQPLTKVRTPQDYLVAVFRAAATPADRRPNFLGLLAGLGQPAFNAPLPNGWVDAAAEWTGPEAMLRRVDWAYGFAGRPELPEPMQLADAALGPLLSPATATAIRQAGSRRDAITLLVASPEMQRR